jgi:hypothetical protein
MKKLLLVSVVSFGLFAEEIGKVIVADDAPTENTTMKGKKITDKQMEELATNISLNPLKQGPAYKVVEMVAGEVVKENNLSISAKAATGKIMDNIMSKRDEVAGVFRFELSPETTEELLKFSKTAAGKEWFEQVGAISQATSTIVMDALKEATEILIEKYGKKKDSKDKSSDDAKKDDKKEDKKSK